VAGICVKAGDVIAMPCPSTPEWHSPDADPRVLDDNGGTGFQCLWILRNRRAQPFPQMIVAGQPEAQQEDT
jgi:hypothetical protein